MKRFSFSLAVFLFLSLSAAWAEDDDKIMGNYQGGFAAPDWSGRHIRAQVVATSDNTHRAVLFIGADEASAVRLQTDGRVRRGVAEFKDTLSLDSLGGAYAFEARIENEIMTGTLKKEGKLAVAFTLLRVSLRPPTLGIAPPEGAALLFDGSNTDQWERWPNGWCLSDEGAMEVCGSNFKTRAEFGGGTYHIEFRTPFMPTEAGQGRGNSGVYLLGRYEVQVLDSFGEEPKDNLCGGIYQFAVPAADAALPPLQWQTYDITFTAPEFDATGNKTQNARIHVLHNGIVIHNDVELASGTPGGISDQEAAAGPLLLQDHGNPVRFRNIWFKPAN